MSSTTQALGSAQSLSAVWDSCADVHEIDSALAAYAHSQEQRDRWRAYMVIGDALRTGVAIPPDEDRIAAIMASVRALPTPEQSHIPPPVGHARQTPANEPVWHWKALAGVFATVAVASAVWGVIGSSTQRSNLAESGPMIRTPELEALLAEHRQNSGLSVVQVSSGFLRNATYEVPVDR